MQVVLGVTLLSVMPGNEATPGVAEVINTTGISLCPSEGASVSHARSSRSERCYLYMYIAASHISEIHCAIVYTPGY